jgi:hypothetical protein
MNWRETAGLDIEGSNITAKMRLVAQSKYAWKSGLHAVRIRVHQVCRSSSCLLFFETTSSSLLGFSECNYSRKYAEYQTQDIIGIVRGKQNYGFTGSKDIYEP